MSGVPTGAAPGRAFLRRTLERSWSAAPRSAAWSKLLLPFSLLYGPASDAARVRAARRRKRAPVYVVAVGGLTAGGSGKSSVARWLAEQAAIGGRVAILLRGHGSRMNAARPSAVPDFAGLDLAARSDRYGDDAIAHRRALPRAAAVLVDKDRSRAAEAAVMGYGARALILDDGWEQPGLLWDELWVVIDPSRPEGNGALLPAGPLRRRSRDLKEATRVVFVLEESRERVSPETEAWVRARAPGAPTLTFRRSLSGLAPPGAWAGDGGRVESGRVALLSGVGAPERLERFALDQGFRVVFHAAFPDHARWEPGELTGAIRAAARAGAEAVLITEKDEARWPKLMAPIPIRVLHTRLEPTGPAEAALAGIRRAVAGPPPIG